MYPSAYINLDLAVQARVDNSSWALTRRMAPMPTNETESCKCKLQEHKSGLWKSTAGNGNENGKGNRKLKWKLLHSTV